jgi:hypothetical protein
LYETLAHRIIFFWSLRLSNFHLGVLRNHADTLKNFWD